MARCEDYPCCGHENGCCPDFSSSGEQLNMICTCGAVVPITSRSSICSACLFEDQESHRDYNDEYPDPDFDEEMEQLCDGHENDDMGDIY